MLQMVLRLYSAVMPQTPPRICSNSLSLKVLTNYFRRPLI